MGFFKDLFGIGEHDNAHFNVKSSTDGTRSVRVSYDDGDKHSGRHETTFSKTDYASGKHVEGWHGNDFPHGNDVSKQGPTAVVLSARRVTDLPSIFF